jgi:hypothetical protein
MVVELLKYLNDKDIFQKYYTIDFAVRLVERSSASSDYEKQMIAKLKSEQGVSFTCSIRQVTCKILIVLEIPMEIL